MGLFDSIKSLVEDVAEVATLPVKVAVDVARIGVAPVAALAKEVSREAGKMADEITQDFEE